MSSRLIAKIHPRFAVVVHDLAMVWLTWVAINSFRWSFETEAARPGLDWFGLEVGLVLAAQGLIFWVTGLYKGLWRFASLPDLWNILRAALLGALLIAVTLFIYNRLATVPRTVLVVYPVCLAVMLGLPRLAYRYWKDNRLDFLSRTPAMRVRSTSRNSSTNASTASFSSAPSASNSSTVPCRKPKTPNRRSSKSVQAGISV